MRRSARAPLGSEACVRVRPESWPLWADELLAIARHSFVAAFLGGPREVPYLPIAIDSRARSQHLPHRLALLRCASEILIERDSAAFRAFERAKTRSGRQVLAEYKGLTQAHVADQLARHKRVSSLRATLPFPCRSWAVVAASSGGGSSAGAPTSGQTAPTAKRLPGVRRHGCGGCAAISDPRPRLRPCGAPGAAGWNFDR